MDMWSVLTALTTKSSTRYMHNPIRCPCATVNCVVGKKPTTARDLTSRSPTSLHWNLSLDGNTTSERQSVTKLRDEYTKFDKVLKDAKIEEFRWHDPDRTVASRSRGSPTACPARV